MATRRLKPILVTAPTAALLTLAEAKAQLRVDHTDEDTYIQALVDAAVAYFDGYSGRLGRAILEQTWRLDFEGFGSELRLPVGNVLAVSSISYYDGSDAQQTLQTSVYQTLVDHLGPYIALKPGQAWPSTYSRADAVRVTWTAGYGGAAASVPLPVKHAALMLVAHWYDNRAAVSVRDTATEVPFAVEALIAPHSVQQLGG